MTLTAVPRGTLETVFSWSQASQHSSFSRCDLRILQCALHWDPQNNEDSLGIFPQGLKQPLPPLSRDDSFFFFFLMDYRVVEADR